MTKVYRIIALGVAAVLLIAGLWIGRLAYDQSRTAIQANQALSSIVAGQGVNVEALKRRLHANGLPTSVPVPVPEVTAIAGAPGLNGANGIPGSSGRRGPTGAVGPQGPQGPAGADGTNGATGATGPAGKDGSDGQNGATGPTGADGAQGPKGDTGATGDTGPAGPQGDTGPTGAPPSSFTFTDLGVTFECTPTGVSNDFDCEPEPLVAPSPTP